MGKGKKPREASLWQRMKLALREHAPTWSATRLESRATLGVPDVLLKDHRGAWHLVELKTTHTRKVDITPHQVAFASKHADASCWILVRALRDGQDRLLLFDGAAAVDLRMEGLSANPVLEQLAPFDWPTVFNTLASSRGIA